VASWARGFEPARPTKCETCRLPEAAEGIRIALEMRARGEFKGKVRSIYRMACEQLGYPYKYTAFHSHVHNCLGGLGT